MDASYLPLCIAWHFRICVKQSRACLLFCKSQSLKRLQLFPVLKGFKRPSKELHEYGKIKDKRNDHLFFKLQNQLQNLFTEEVLIDRVFLSFFPIYFFFVNLTFFFNLTFETDPFKISGSKFLLLEGTQRPACLCGLGSYLLKTLKALSIVDRDHSGQRTLQCLEDRPQANFSGY